jgi:hypothetical protein
MKSRLALKGRIKTRLLGTKHRHSRKLGGKRC